MDGNAMWGQPPSAVRRAQARFLFPLRRPKTKMAQSPKACATNFSLYFQNIKLTLFNRQAFEKYFRPEMSNLAQKPRDKGLDRFWAAAPTRQAAPLRPPPTPPQSTASDPLSHAERSSLQTRFR